MNRRLAHLTGSLLALLFLQACASQPAGEPGAPGFWLGLWHGFTAPITFVISLFNEDVRIYSFPNSGRWYDFGFLIGACSWGGAGAAARR